MAESGRNLPQGEPHALRGATTAAHHALDHHPLLQRLTRSDLTREQYAESLAALHRPHALLERLVHASRHYAGSGLSLGTRLHLLEADLVDVGRPLPPVPEALPEPMDGRAAWWGRVYVLEGSRQGGAFIGKRIRASLGDTVPCRFFAAALAPGDQRAMQAMREHELEAPGEFERAVASARAAFATYGAGLDAFECAGTTPNRGQGV